jgi:hypothetical protein
VLIVMVVVLIMTDTEMLFNVNGAMKKSKLCLKGE